MAIRLELPPALFPRLNKAWQNAGSYFQKQYVHLRTVTVRTLRMPIACWQDLSARYSTSWSRQARAEARRLQDFEEFEEKYEKLVDLLCWTAHEGLQPEREAGYVELRLWMCVNYRKVRSQLRPYWVEEGAPEQIDPFEALFAAEHIDAFINAPNGIYDLMQSRAALEAYHEANTPLPH